MSKKKAEKKRTTVTINAASLAAARELGLDVSEIVETALVAAIKAARTDLWKKENAEAIAEHRAWVEANGLPDIRGLKVD